MKATTSSVPSSGKQFSVYVASRANQIILGLGVAIVVVLAVLPALRAARP